MKTLDEVSYEKIRGGFYSPQQLVSICVQRIRELTYGRTGLRVLEPSAGNGAFLAGLAASDLAPRVQSVLAIELIVEEAAKCRTALACAPFAGRVEVGSALVWACSTNEMFDVAVGNPPFVRYQFVSSRDRAWAGLLARRLGISLAGVSNLWIPVFLSALSHLETHGAFAFIIPTECLTGISAGMVRQWLGRHVDELRLDLFPAGSFPEVLQEVLVVSGIRRAVARTTSVSLVVCEHQEMGLPGSWSHMVPQGPHNWTRYLLAPVHIEAYEEAAHLAATTRLGYLAKFEVAAVTGANDYFSVDATTVNRYQLHAWTRPLLPRIRYARGLCYAEADYAATVAQGAKAMLLDFAPHLPDPESQPGPRQYLAMGGMQRLPSRYKCSIRQPWYRVPLVKPGRLMLSKRCHRFPRVVLNRAGVVTTDTIYRGWMAPLYEAREQDLVAAFHNSMTLLSAEVEGRSFGGGVLELVPTEITRLLVPFQAGFGRHLDRLDAITRSSDSPDDSENLVDETDACLVAADGGFSRNLLDRLREARGMLLSRRLARN